MTRTDVAICSLCEAACGLEVEHDGWRIHAIRGNARDVMSRGYVCPKGVALMEIQHDPDHVLEPQKRVGDRWEAVGWEEALADIGARIARIREERGKDAVGLALLVLLSACGSTTPVPTARTDAAGSATRDASAVEDAGSADASPTEDASAPIDASPAEDASAPIDASASPAARAPVMFQTADGVQIAAVLVTAGASPPGSPGVVLVHQYRQSMQQWGQYPEQLAEAGYRVLAFDLRGHGASGPYARPIDQLLTDPQGAPRDVAAALRYLADQGAADPARVGVVGTSIGANLAVAAAIARLPATAVALSPRLPPTESLAQSPARGMTSVFYLSAENDSGGQAADCRTMHTATTEPRRLMIIPGANSHGIDLLTRHPEVEAAVRTWLDEQLR